MDLLSIRTIKSLLSEYGVKPSKKWGQNFLTDRNVQRRMLEAARLEPDDVVLEIGAGLGALTFALAQRVRQVIAVEVDPRLVAALQGLLEEVPNVRLLNANVLHLSVADLLGEEPTAKVVANLPYVITSPLLECLLKAKEHFPVMALMVQKEVADRLNAKPDTEAYGSLSLFVQYHAQVEYLGRVPNTAFYPQPEVDSAIVRLTPIPNRLEPLVEKRLFRLIRASFRQRRKTLRNALSKLFENPNQAAAALRVCGIDPNRRGETLSLEEFIRLAENVE